MERIFVGRERELSDFESIWERALSGASQVVLVEGPPGIGKSSLLDRLPVRCRGAFVVGGGGEEAEQYLPYGLLSQLVDQLDLRDGVRPRGSSDPFVVGAELVDCLGRLAERDPILLMIDDLHWADQPSLRAITFALRRMRADPILVVMTARTDHAWDLPKGLADLLSAGGGRLQLGGLETSEIAELAACLGRPLARPASERLRAHTGGNPLHVLALLSELSPEVLRAPGRVLPAPRGLAATLAARLLGCRPETEKLVAAASVFGFTAPLADAAAVAGLEDPFPALAEAEEAGLLESEEEIAGRIVRFSHPLIRSAIYGEVAPDRRAAFHRRAAQVVGNEGVALRHRLAATGSPDPGLVEAACHYAARVGGEGRLTEAAELFLSAIPAQDGESGRASCSERPITW